MLCRVVANEKPQATFAVSAMVGSQSRKPCQLHDCHRQFQSHADQGAWPCGSMLQSHVDGAVSGKTLSDLQTYEEFNLVATTISTVYNEAAKTAGIPTRMLKLLPTARGTEPPKRMRIDHSKGDKDDKVSPAQTTPAAAASSTQSASSSSKRPQQQKDEDQDGKATSRLCAASASRVLTGSNGDLAFFGEDSPNRGSNVPGVDMLDGFKEW